MNILTADSQEDRARLLDAVAREIDMGSPEQAREAAELLVAQLAAEGEPLAEEHVLAQARKRYFLTLDDAWRALFAGGDAGDLAELVRRELRPRIAADDTFLQVKLLLRCKERSTELMALMNGTLERHGPQRAKHAACAAVWRELVGIHLEHESQTPRSQQLGRLNHEFELHATEVLQMMEFLELVDLAQEERTEIVLDATPPIPTQVGGVEYDDTRGREPSTKRRRRPMRTRETKPRQRRALSEEELRRLAEAAEILERAVPAARHRLAKSSWATVVNKMVDGDLDGISEAQVSRAYHRLGKALNHDGFACGKTIGDPEEFLGARHVFPTGCVMATVQDPGTREGRAFAAEAEGKPLKAVAEAGGYTWPAAGDADAAWAGVTECLSALRASRRGARGDTPAIHEGDPFSRLPTGLPSRFTKPRSTVRREKLDNADVRLFEYGRVIVLPTSALPIEALSRRADRHDEVLVPPLNKTHVGEWYFFPQKGIDG